MGTLFVWIGRLGGSVGVVLSAVAVFARYRGTYNVAGFQVGTLLLGGIAAMVLGCLGYLAFMAERAGK